MKPLSYTLLYGVIFCCCSSPIPVTRRQASLLSDSLIRGQHDSTLLHQIAQTIRQTDYQIVHQEYVQPDSTGLQYLKSTTMVCAREQKKEVIQIQAKDFSDREEQHIRNEEEKKSEIVEADIRWRVPVLIQYLNFIAFFLVVLKYSLPVVKHLLGKVVAK